MKKTMGVTFVLVLGAMMGLSLSCGDILDEMLRELMGSVAVDAMRAAYIDSRQILDDGRIHVVLAGTGSPRIDGDRSHPCTALVANGLYLYVVEVPWIDNRLQKFERI